MNIWKIEVKKIIYNPMLWVLLVLAIVIDGIKINASINRVEKPKKIEHAYVELYNKLDGELTQEKVNYISQKYAYYTQLISKGNYSIYEDSAYETGYAYADYNLYKFAYETIAYMLNYEEECQKLMGDAGQFVAFLESGNIKEKYLQIENGYNGRKLTCFYRTDIWEEYLRYDFSSLLVIVLCIACSYLSFSDECEKGMKGLLNTTTFGRRKNAWAKIMASFVVSLLITVVIFTFDFCLFNYRIPLTHSDEYLYSVPIFARCVFNGTIRDCMLLIMINRVIGVLCVSGVTLAVSSLVSSNINSLLVSGVVIACDVVLSHKNIPINIVELLNVANEMATSVTLDRLYCYFVSGCLLVVISILFVLWNSGRSRND